MPKKALSSQVAEWCPRTQADQLLLEFALDCKREANFFMWLGFHIVVKVPRPPHGQAVETRMNHCRAVAAARWADLSNAIYGGQEQQDTLWGCSTSRCHRWFWTINLHGCQTRSTGDGALNLEWFWVKSAELSHMHMLNRGGVNGGFHRGMVYGEPGKGKVPSL